MIGFPFINAFVKGNHLLVKQTLFFLTGSYERMKQTGDSVGLFWAKDSVIHVPHILNRKECVGIC
jgi:hypothetical protein